MSEKKVMNVVIVGCGGISFCWFKEAVENPKIQIVGIVDLDRAAAEAKAKEFELTDTPIFTSLTEALAETKPDAVFDVTVPVAHGSVVIEALEAGCHVLGEKPMSDSLETAQKMVAAAETAGKTYAVSQTRRPVPFALRAQKAIADGVIGKVAELHGDFYLGIHFSSPDKKNFRDVMAHPLVLDMAIHTFDTARQLSGADPVSVYCQEWNPGHSWYDGDVSAAAIFEMKLPDGSPVFFTYRGSWCNEGLTTDWNGDWRVAGSKGTLHTDGAAVVEAEVVENPEELGFARTVKAVEIPEMDMPVQGHSFIINQFADHVLAGGELMCPCSDNIKSLAMVEAAVKSAEAGQKVPVTW